MLSVFVKKLMFMRQFFMEDGKLEIVGEKYALISHDVLRGITSKRELNLIKDNTEKAAEAYMKRLNLDLVGFIENLADMYNLYGLGSLEVVRLSIEDMYFEGKIKGISKGLEEYSKSILQGMLRVIFMEDMRCESESVSGVLRVKVSKKF